MEDISSRKRVRDESDEPEIDSPEVKRLRDDLLGVLDESDPDPAIQDLDSFMKSFEEEISASSPSPVPVVDLTSNFGESRTDLGYLLEASDDELGLPPTNTSSDEFKNEVIELVRVSSDSSGIDDFWGFDDQIPSYDSFVYGAGENIDQEYVALDGLFDHSDVFYPSDYTEFS
ncbi:hypothetical protein HS088_TW02G00948 [Tripterygium wilfordii]|uniref:Uncharacterized protein n=1 Tax=Tripterygium wilfordii TaxID=458696 RepID=A0A7J7E074_TRIWF|nr:uncharacterized protein LOC120006974 [Tripterygium wilfordii]KAF5751929.1 hypothetical protein HS088_TW02G00948 [Tripterygium wilfordii]